MNGDREGNLQEPCRMGNPTERGQRDSKRRNQGRREKNEPKNQQGKAKNKEQNHKDPSHKTSE